MISVTMFDVVAAKDFDATTDALDYISPDDFGTPLLGPDALSIDKGTALCVIGYDPERRLFFATNCRQMPFCSVATTGFVPVDIFEPVLGFEITESCHGTYEQRDSLPASASSLWTPVSSNPHTESEMDECALCDRYAATTDQYSENSTQIHVGDLVARNLKTAAHHAGN
ncbi:hypothetical protein BJ742DRAFT_841003 [Cladochytrium replicatum]|nr:hypothetical protein BJ742DRAFT_841003 [Cladochytrium replicatum]